MPDAAEKPAEEEDTLVLGFCDGSLRSGAIWGLP